MRKEDVGYLTLPNFDRLVNALINLYSRLCASGRFECAVALDTRLACANDSKPDEKPPQDDRPKTQSDCRIWIKAA